MCRWYNTTYVLNATMIILYVLFTGVHDTPEIELQEDVDKSLEVFQAMNRVVVARRCAQLTREVSEVAKAVTHEREARQADAQAVSDSRNTQVVAVTNQEASTLDLLQHAGAAYMRDFASGPDVHALQRGVPPMDVSGVEIGGELGEALAGLGGFEGFNFDVADVIWKGDAVLGGDTSGAGEVSAASVC